MKRIRVFENITFVVKRVLRCCPGYLFVTIVTSALASCLGVSYSYEGSPSELLKNVNIDLKHGEKVVIIGQNGKGKSTLAKLLCGLYPPTEGDVFINNVPLRNYDIQQYRRCCCIISQDFTILAASIAETY